LEERGYGLPEVLSRNFTEVYGVKEERNLSQER